jgi:hypothetical protein
LEARRVLQQASEPEPERPQPGGTWGEREGKDLAWKSRRRRRRLHALEDRIF